MRRIESGVYETLNGAYRVERVKDPGYPVVWWVTERDNDTDTHSTGFDSLKDAVAWLHQRGAE